MGGFHLIQQLREIQVPGLQSGCILKFSAEARGVLGTSDADYPLRRVLESTTLDD